MGLPSCIGPSAVARNESTPRGTAQRLRLCNTLAVLALLSLFRGAPDGSGCGTFFAFAAEAPLSAPAAEATSLVSPAVGSESGFLHPQKPAAASRSKDSEVEFRPIRYGSCSMPLAVGGEIIRCKGEEGGSPYVALSTVDWPVGPLLNQTFPVDLPADFFLRRTMARQSKAESGTPGSTVTLPSATGQSGGDGEANYAQSNEKGALNDPHFIRIFGRWTTFPRGLNLWLDTNATPPLERKLIGKTAPPAASKEQDPSTDASLQTVKDNPAFSAGVAARPRPRRRHPFLYWRQSITSSPMEDSCVAFIKLPVREGVQNIPASNSGAKVIPESCEEAQLMLSSEKSEESTAEPFWLACSPEPQLSRLARYITFAVPQEKVTRVLDALDYSVEIWREAHEMLHKPKWGAEVSSLDSTGESAEATKDQKPATSSVQHQASVVRDVEARRLSALRGDLIETPAKWKVGVCLLNNARRKPKRQEGETQDENTSSDAAGDVARSAQTLQTHVQEENGAEDTEAENGLHGETAGHDDTKEKTRLFKDPQLVGELKFHISPVVAPQADDDPQDEPETVQIRHFIDAGWMFTKYIDGVNVSRFNRLAIKESPVGIAQPCLGFWDEHSLLSVAPDGYSWDEATNKGTLRFVFSSSLKDTVGNSDALFDAVPGHHATSRMHICFYPNEEQPFGMFMGEVRFIIDSADATLLVCFILFVFLALPLSCSIAISFHVYKHRHLRERLQRLVLVQQRDAVEQLLMRELGLTAEDQEDVYDDDDDDELHT
ncbi:hypothetical protein, conserved [Eimeria necatrix]|uniref:Transmembrane protein n=1 Tax=Eimeria necatrix TaxID=51315 RepID=U6MLR7_9EIME|nr:hypothetical protein, conserved [Eimeria necatrix]CDJ64966.1 hypothetical protein, conserved [Eimeria necatrix]